MAREFLEDGKSVAVGSSAPCVQIRTLNTDCANPDNTNADIKAREYWTKLAESLKIPVRCVHFTAPSKLCEHNDAVRSIGGQQLGVIAKYRDDSVAPTDVFRR